VRVQLARQAARRSVLFNVPEAESRAPSSVWGLPSPEQPIRWTGWSAPSELKKNDSRTIRIPHHLNQGANHPIMRPKKIILCVDDNEQDLSVTTFMLSTNGYKVIAASGGQEALGIFAGTQIDLVLADHSMQQMNGSQLVDRLKRIGPHVPMILLGDPQRMAGEIHSADALLNKKNCSPLELLERIKVMSTRKRGPRKGTVRLAPAAELAAAS
jgi:two-component system response regulator CpxR